MTDSNKPRAAGRAAALFDAPASAAVPAVTWRVPMLASWLSDRRYDDDRPCQRPIAESPQARALQQFARDREAAYAYLGSIAAYAAAVPELINAPDKMPHRLPLLAATAPIGSVTDVLFGPAFQGQGRGGSDAWLLQRSEAAALNADRGEA